MAAVNRFPRDLAAAVCAELDARGRVHPDLDILTTLFETLYFASLQTEEGRPITCSAAYVDPANPDPPWPAGEAARRWSYVRMASAIPLTTSSLVKLAHASSAPVSTLAVYPDAQGELFIWGLVAQGRVPDAALDVPAGRLWERPGTLQVDILDVGHLLVQVGGEKVAELRTNSLLRKKDIFGLEAVRAVLQPGVDAYLNTVSRLLPKGICRRRERWEAQLTADWIAALRAVLLRARDFRHGGALLLTPDASLRGLSVTYAIDYQGLRTALEARAAALIRQAYAAERIAESYGLGAPGPPVRDSIPLYVEEAALMDRFLQSRGEMAGAIGFTALLTRVDGLVLLNPRLEVRGFGVEITVTAEPERLMWAETERVCKRHVQPAEYSRFGMRHKSMMRYCAQMAGSLGFVISQDGEVRVMTQVDGQLILWDNIKLRPAPPQAADGHIQATWPVPAVSAEDATAIPSPSR